MGYNAIMVPFFKVRLLKVIVKPLSLSLLSVGALIPEEVFIATCNAEKSYQRAALDKIV